MTESAAPAPSTAAPTKPRGADEVRSTRVDVGPDFTLHTVEFGDRDNGYAIFIGCDQAGPQPAEGCPAALFGTHDGGRTWQPIRHPHALAENHQMYVRGDKLILLAEPHGWWISTDRGRTFAHDRGEGERRRTSTTRRSAAIRPAATRTTSGGSSSSPAGRCGRCRRSRRYRASARSGSAATCCTPPGCKRRAPVRRRLRRPRPHLEADAGDRGR